MTLGDILVFKDEDNKEIEIMIIGDRKYIDVLFLTDYSEVCEAHFKYSKFGYKYMYVDSLIEGIKKDMSYMNWELINIKYNDD